MNGQQTSSDASICGAFQEQAAPVAEVACEKIYLVYSPNATYKNDYCLVATVLNDDGTFDQIPYTKLFRDNNWNGWQDRCVWTDAYHIATIDESRVTSYSSTHGMPAEKMPSPGNVSSVFKPKL